MTEKETSELYIRLAIQWEILPWLNHSRQLSKDYEISVSSAETMVKISHFHTLLKRL